MSSTVRGRVLRRVMTERATRCSRCNGRGTYLAAYPQRSVACTRCGGAGRLSNPVAHVSEREQARLAPDDPPHF